MYAHSKTVGMSFQQAVAAAKEALKAQGFGVLCEIDVQAKLKEKTGEDIGPYMILGACNPELATRAFAAEPLIGTLLPCNVVVMERGGAVTVGMVDAVAMLELVGNSELDPVANDAAARLRAALDGLT